MKIKEGLKVTIGLSLIITLCIITVSGFATWWYPSTPDFVLNETSDFDAGFKANNSDGNFNIETYTDNLAIAEDTFELSNKYSDRFTFDDADADTWKWDYYEDESFGSASGNINGGVLYLELQEGAEGYDPLYNWVRLSGVILTGDFDVQVDYLNYDDASGFDMYPGLYLTDNTNMWTSTWGVAMTRITQNPAQNENYAAWDFYGLIWTDTADATGEDSGKLRITREISGNYAIYTWYYWDSVGSSWVQYEQENYDWTEDTNYKEDLYVFLDFDCSQWLDSGAISIEYDNFKINSGTFVPDTANPYKETGNWTSDTITIDAGKNLKNVTFNFSMEESGNYLDFLWFKNSTGDGFFYFDGDMLCSSGCLYTVTKGVAEDQFNDTVTDNFTITIGFKSLYGNTTPTLHDITGYYETLPAPPVITLLSPLNTSYCGSVLINASVSADSCWYSIDSGTEVNMTSGTGFWYGTYTGTNCTDNSHNVNVTCVNADGTDSEIEYFWACPCCGSSVYYPLKKVLW